MKEIDRFVSKLDFDQLLEKIKDWGKTLGRTSMRPVLSLYYVLKSPDTPLSDKLLVVSALSYLIFPVLGWIDEITAVTIAYKKVKKHITPEIESKVDNILEKWFPELKYEILL